MAQFSLQNDKLSHKITKLVTKTIKILNFDHVSSVLEWSERPIKLLNNLENNPFSNFTAVHCLYITLTKFQMERFIGTRNLPFKANISILLNFLKKNILIVCS